MIPHLIYDYGYWQNRLKSCKSNPNFGTTYEETIVAVLGNSTDLPFTTIIG